MKKKLVRIATIPLSLNVFCRGLLAELSSEYEVVAVSSPGSELDEIAQREGVRTVAIPMQRHIAPLSDLISLVRLFRLFRRERPDIVHSMTPKAGLLAMMAARMARVPARVHTFTGLVFPSASGLKRQLLMLTDRITCRCATHVVPEGEGVKRDLQRFGITRKPMQVLGYGNVRGIDLDYYCRTAAIESQASSLRRSLSIPPHAFVYVFVGRITHDKGIDELVSAFCHLYAKRSDVYLMLVGDEESIDPLAPATRSKISKAYNIFHFGWQSDVRPWYAAANALVFPSHREGFPNVVIEACAMGLPCIVTDINGSNEIIVEGHNGTIIPPNDADKLYQAMKKIVELRAHTTATMAANARQSVASRFEQSYVRQCLKDFYQVIRV